jgi:hypothetical protein
VSIDVSGDLADNQESQVPGYFSFQTVEIAGFGSSRQLKSFQISDLWTYSVPGPLPEILPPAQHRTRKFLPGQPGTPVLAPPFQLLAI